MKSVKLLLSLFIMLFCNFNVHAACVWGGEGPGPSHWIFNVGTINAGSTSINVSFYSNQKSLDSIGTHRSFSCGPIGTKYTNALNMSGAVDPDASNSSVYNVGLDGIGVQIHLQLDPHYTTYELAPTIDSFTSPSTYFGTGNGIMKVDLFKTKDSPSAGSFSYMVPNFYVVNGGGSSLLFGDLTVTGTIIVPACSIMTNWNGDGICCSNSG